MRIGKIVLEELQRAQAGKRKAVRDAKADAERFERATKKASG
jgi:hypothetical protein